MLRVTIRSCFISAPAGSKLRLLQQALTQRGIRIVSPGERVDLPSGSLPNVDLVVGVVDSSRQSQWVLFDMGQAFSKGIPILLLVAPRVSVSALPAFPGVLTVRTNLSNGDAIGFALDQLLAAPGRADADQAPKSKARGLGGQSEALLRATDDALVKESERDLVRVLESALRQSGIDAYASRAMDDSGADMAIWSDGLESAVGNPLLIEIKSQLSERDVRKEGLRLSKFIESSGSRWGLLVYGVGRLSGSALGMLPPNVLAISMTDLLRRMRDRDFARVVNDLRNQRVHGVAD